MIKTNETPNAFSVSGSYGYIAADATTGKVIMYDPDGYTTENEYADIVRLDVDELKATYGYTPETLVGKHFDILDVGFWTDKGVYEAPEADWRAMATAIEGGVPAADAGF